MNLEKLRLNVGLKPSFVSEKLGVSYRMFHRIEKGEGYLTKERIKILSKLYGVTMSEIVEGGKASEKNN